jgi:hypothetical protein
MTNLESALTQARPWANGARHAMNTELRAGLVAVLEDCEIRVGIALDQEVLVDLADWRDVADLKGWRPA